MARRDDAPQGDAVIGSGSQAAESPAWAWVTQRLPLLMGVVALLVFGLAYWVPRYRYDEYLVAVGRTGLPWDELLRVIATVDPGPGPLYLLMKPWTAVSTEPWWTRIPSLVSMAGAVGGLVVLARWTAGVPAAVFAGLLLVALPGASRWAQDNRMYAPATAFAVLAVLCWWRSLGSDRRRWSVGYGGAVFAMGLLHLYSLALLPALGLATLWVPGPRRSLLLRTLVPPVVAVVVLLPHLYLNLAHPTGSPTNPPVSVRTLMRIATQDFGRLSSVAVALLAAVGAIVAWRVPRRRPVVVLGVAWVVVPLGLFVLARGLIGMPTLSPRYLVFVLPGACLVAALGLAALAERWRVAALVALAVVAVLVLPAQLRERAVDSHSPNLYRFGLLLHTLDDRGMVIATTTAGSALMVNAATYPARVLTPADASAGDVAAIVGRVPAAGDAPPGTLLGAARDWRTVVVCRQSKVIRLVVAPGASLPGGDPGAFASGLNAAVRGARCQAAASR